MRPFDIQILASDHVFYEGEILSVVIPTVDGYYGVMARHTNVIIGIVPGIFSYTLPDGIKREASVSFGMLKVEKGKVLVLVDTIEKPEDIDINLAERQAAQAKEALLQKKKTWEYNVAHATLARVASRIKLRNKYRK